MEATAEPAPPRFCKLAIASLVVSLIPIVGLFGLIMGVVAAIRISRSNGTLRGMGFALGGIAASFIVIAITGFSALSILPALAKARAAARMHTSSKQMQALTMSCHLYSDLSTSRDEFPVDLSQLYPNQVNDYRIFKNPRFPNEAVGYIYVSGLTLKDNAGVLIYEAVPAINPPKEINICFVDGTAKSILTTELMEYLAKTKTLCEANGKEFKEVPVDYTKLAPAK